MVKAIQVGLGSWGFSWSKDVIPNVPSIEMVAYADASPAATGRVQTELKIDPQMCFSSLSEAARAVEADLVIATLRTEAHYPVVKEALQLGFNVIVEKPFASTMAQAKELVALAEAQSRVLMVSQNYRFQQAPIAVAEFMAARKFGPINQVSIDFRRHAPTQGYRYWDMPDPLLADMSIHHFDLMRMVLTLEPVRVSCRTWNPEGSPFAHHPTGAALIEFDTGIVVSYRASWVSTGKHTA
jgi:predicted dehydrogenase